MQEFIEGNKQQSKKFKVWKNGLEKSLTLKLQNLYMKMNNKERNNKWEAGAGEETRMKDMASHTSDWTTER